MRWGRRQKCQSEPLVKHEEEIECRTSPEGMRGGVSPLACWMLLSLPHRCGPTLSVPVIWVARAAKKGGHSRAMPCARVSGSEADATW